ncbi:hypothetical protein DP117_21100 [Brasilonema sp. UFV-L1]|nr:hypothetical protein [Brasilonema sp. UFV-L1]
MLQRGEPPEALIGGNLRSNNSWQRTGSPPAALAHESRVEIATFLDRCKAGESNLPQKIGSLCFGYLYPKTSTRCIKAANFSGLGSVGEQWRFQQSLCYNYVRS